MPSNARIRIAVYAIALDEELHARRFVEACAGADLVLIADTGSRDGTIATARQAGADIVSLAIAPWRFDDARNAALALLPRDIDACIALDLDEILSPGWADAFRAAWVPGTTRGRYRHVWTHTPDGAPHVHYIADRAHARFGYRWRHACHEALYPDRIVERGVMLDGMQVDHWPDLGKSRGGYLALLEATRDEDPDCSRNSFNLGREYRQHGRHADAERELRRYLTLRASTWAVQNAVAIRHIAACRRAQDDEAGALDWLRRAVAEAPDERDGWVSLAQASHRIGDWTGCHGAALTALALPFRPSSSISEPECEGEAAHDLASIAAWHLGRPAEALGHAERAAALAPHDARIADNLRIIRGRVAAVTTGA